MLDIIIVKLQVSVDSPQKHVERISFSTQPVHSSKRKWSYMLMKTHRFNSQSAITIKYFSLILECPSEQ